MSHEIAPTLQAALNEPDFGLEQTGQPPDMTVSRLSRLSQFEYDRCRKQIAKKMNVRVQTLDVEVGKMRNGDATMSKKAHESVPLINDPEPWPEIVDGSKLLDEIAQLLSQYLVLSEGASYAIALWVVHSYVHEASRISPILCITSPDKRCGKTTLLSLLQVLTRRSLPASNITSAATFRAIDKWHPTLIIDEADTFVRENNELRGILNSGHRRDTAQVIRVEGEDFEPRAFSTWTPKAIALIGLPHPTLIDRSIMIHMRRKRPDESVLRLKVDRLTVAKDIQRQAIRWAIDHMQELSESNPDTPKELNDRAADNWETLLAIADAAGGEWPEKARESVKKMNDKENDDSAGVMLLQDINFIFGEQDEINISSADLIKALGEMEDRPWPEWYHGKPITPRQVAKLLKPFGIKPKNIRDSFRVQKGYEKEQFADAFTRYLPNQSATQLHSEKDSAILTFQSATDISNVAGHNESNLLKNKECSVVAEKLCEKDGVVDSIEHQERLAIMEIDGGLTHDEAVNAVQKILNAEVVS